MTATGVLWPSFYTGDGTRIRKWLYGSVLVRDWDAAGSTALNNFNPFLANGNLDPTILLPVSQGGLGFYDVGSITENGVEFNPKFTVDDTKIWQSRRTQRTDITEDDEEVMFSCAESTPLIDFLFANKPIGFTGVPTFPSLGTQGYSNTKPIFSDVVYRQLIIVGVDGSVGANGMPEYLVEARPRVTLSKKGKRQWAAKQVDVTELTYSVHLDPFSGFDSKQYRGGIVWLDEGGPVTFATPQVAPVGTAGATGKASLVLAQPVSPNQPFTYAVQKSTDSGVTWTSATLDTTFNVVGYNTDGSGNVTVKVTGVTAGSTLFRVVATAANLTVNTSSASNAVTIT